MPPAEPTDPARPSRPARSEPSPDFGPGGYLPERAAKRARKIVLREQMGMQWPVAAAVAALVVLIAGGIFLVAGTGPPGPPFQPVLQVEEVDPRGAEILMAGAARDDLTAVGRDIVVVRAGGGIRAFLAPEGLVWCAASGRLEAPAQGTVWNTNGRLVGGPGTSLLALPSQAFDGVLYVDETTLGPPVPGDDAGQTPRCSPQG